MLGATDSCWWLPTCARFPEGQALTRLHIAVAHLRHKPLMWGRNILVALNRLCLRPAAIDGWWEEMEKQRRQKGQNGWKQSGEAQTIFCAGSEFQRQICFAGFIPGSISEIYKLGACSGWEDIEIIFSSTTPSPKQMKRDVVANRIMFRSWVFFVCLFERMQHYIYWSVLLSLQGGWGRRRAYQVHRCHCRGVVLSKWRFSVLNMWPIPKLN